MFWGRGSVDCAYPVIAGWVLCFREDTMRVGLRGFSDTPTSRCCWESWNSLEWSQGSCRLRTASSLGQEGGLGWGKGVSGLAAGIVPSLVVAVWECRGAFCGRFSCASVGLSQAAPVDLVYSLFMAEKWIHVLLLRVDPRLNTF